MKGFAARPLLRFHASSTTHIALWKQIGALVFRVLDVGCWFWTLGASALLQGCWVLAVLIPIGSSFERMTDPRLGPEC